MSSSPIIDLRFGGYIACVPTVAVLRAAIDPTQFVTGDAIIVSGNASISDGEGGIYAWLADSTANDDNYAVIEPLSVKAGPGRWVLAVGPTPELASLLEAVNGFDSQLASLSATLSSRTTTLESEYTAQAGDIASTKATLTSEQSVRASADGALAQQITSLTASTTTAQNNLSAQITTTSQAQTNATNALATRTSTLEATTGSLSSQVTTTESAVSALNGKTAAYWSVESVAGNNRAQLTVHADANGGAGVDIVGDVSITGDLIVTGTVTTDKLVDGSVSGGDFPTSTTVFTGGGGVDATVPSYTVGSWQTVLSSTYTIAAAARMDVVAGYKQGHSDGNADWACRLLIDGNVVDDGWGESPCDRVGLLGSANVAAGSRVVSLQWQALTSVSCVRPKFKVTWTYK